MFRKILIAVACASLMAFAADDPVAAIKKKDTELQARKADFAALRSRKLESWKTSLLSRLQARKDVK